MPNFKGHQILNTNKANELHQRYPILKICSNFSETKSVYIFVELVLKLLASIFRLPFEFKQ